MSHMIVTDNISKIHAKERKEHCELKHLKNKHLLAACVARAVVGVEWEEAGEMAIVGCSGSWAAQLNSTTEMFPLSPPYTQLQRAQLRRNLRIINVA